MGKEKIWVKHNLFFFSILVIFYELLRKTANLNLKDNLKERIIYAYILCMYVCVYIYIHTRIYSKSSLSTYKTTTVIENAELEWTMVPNK